MNEGKSMKNFAIIGVAGYIAERHVNAINATGNRLVAALDPHDSVGFLDRYDFDTNFFTEIERFDRYVEKLRFTKNPLNIDYVSICSPNYLHDAHCRFGLRLGANVICEKPLVINPWNLDPLKEIEQETGNRISTVLQLRLIPELIKLKEKIASESFCNDVSLTYITSRGSWYYNSWKGSIEKSGGILTNIGIHFFDLLLWIFGPVIDKQIYLLDERRASGVLMLEKANVSWFLSTNHKDLPFKAAPGKKTTHRTIVIDGEEVDFSEGFNNLHTRVYEDILSGKGFGINDARPSIQLTYDLRNLELSTVGKIVHPIIKGIR